MRRLLAIALLLAVCASQAAERITLLITVTNVPVTGNTLTINSGIRTWTNAATVSTILTNLVSTNHATTNLFSQIASFPYPGGIVQQWASSNALRLIAPFGSALSGLQTGNWASLTLSTQSGPSTFPVLWPLENMVGPTNRTNEASSLVYGLSTFSTQAFSSASTAVSNLVNLYSNQIVAGNKTFTGTNTFTNSVFLAGRIVNALLEVTNLIASNATIHSLVMTNGTNFGAAFSSPGPYPNSQQFGGGTVTAGGALAMGFGSLAGTNGVALGQLAGAGHFSVALGSGADASGATNSVSLGQNSSINAASNAVALGKDTVVGDRHHNSIVIGYAAVSTTNDQVVLGSSSHSVIIPGVISGASVSNLTLLGTNRVVGDLSFLSTPITSVANGHNTISVGSNVYVRITGSPSAAWTLGGITGGNRDGKFLLVENATGQDVTVQNESGTEPTAANRILTYSTGAGVTNITIVGNGVLGVIYSGTLSRWVTVIPFGDITATATNAFATNSQPYALGTNDFALNTYYTNSAQRSMVFATISMTNVLGADMAKVSLFLDQDADGTWEHQGINCRLQGVALLSGSEELSAALQPGARFMFTNQTTGTAASAINANSSQWVRQ